MKCALKIVIVFVLCVVYSVAKERELKLEKNPGCTNKDYCGNVILYHVIADSDNDTLHHIWSFIGKPVLLVALTNQNSKLTIDWDKLMFADKDDSISIQFIPEPIYSFGFMLNKIIEFRDPNDTASLTNATNVHVYDTAEYDWSDNIVINSTQLINIEARAKNISQGNITIYITTYNNYGFGLKLPHLLHSENCSQFEISLDGMKIDKNQSRFAVELLLASSEINNNTSFKLNEYHSLDDEHTPGVFDVVDLLSPETVIGKLGGYLQWRPVAYTEPERLIETSTEVKYYDNQNNSNINWNNTVLLAFYGYPLDDQTLLTKSLNISFGVSEDGFYEATNYLVWTLSMGFGQPPKEHFSLLVILVLGIGLGLPVLIVISGTCYILCCKRKRSRDELLIGN